MNEETREIIAEIKAIGKMLDEKIEDMRTELKEEIPVTEHQVLSIHLRRKAGKIEIAQWQTIATDEPQQEQYLNVWTNESEGTP